MLPFLRSSRLAALLAVFSLALGATPAARACAAMVAAEVAGRACCCPAEMHGEQGACPMHPGGMDEGAMGASSVREAACCIGAPEAPTPERTNLPSPGLAALLVSAVVAGFEPTKLASHGPAPDVLAARPPDHRLHLLHGCFLN